VSKVGLIYYQYKLLSLIRPLNRCTALPANLDDDLTAIARCPDHTQALQDAFVDEPQILWDGYGIINDIIVRSVFIVKANI